MKYAYDFHIHTALSPCADNDMTPNNIVNMALIKELDIIAVTDHNSAENIEAIMNVAEQAGLVVIPGMELECAEEFHNVCLFPNIEGVHALQQYVYENLPPLKNKKEIFGSQLVLDENDEVVYENDKMLIAATGISIYELVPYVKKLGGVVIPAHVDRQSYSILASLGIIPEDLGFRFIEISKMVDCENFDEYSKGKYFVVSDSDAHHLEDISERQNFIELPDKSAEAVINHIRGAI